MIFAVIIYCVCCNNVLQHNVYKLIYFKVMAIVRYLYAVEKSCLPFIYFYQVLCCGS